MINKKITATFNWKDLNDIDTCLYLLTMHFEERIEEANSYSDAAARDKGKKDAREFIKKIERLRKVVSEAMYNND